MNYSRIIIMHLVLQFDRWQSPTKKILITPVPISYNAENKNTIRYKYMQMPNGRKEFNTFCIWALSARPPNSSKSTSFPLTSIWTAFIWRKLCHFLSAARRIHSIIPGKSHSRLAREIHLFYNNRTERDLVLFMQQYYKIWHWENYFS